MNLVKTLILNLKLLYNKFNIFNPSVNVFIRMIKFQSGENIYKVYISLSNNNSYDSIIEYKPSVESDYVNQLITLLRTIIIYKKLNNKTLNLSFNNDGAILLSILNNKLKHDDKNTNQNLSELYKELEINNISFNLEKIQ